MPLALSLAFALMSGAPGAAAPDPPPPVPATPPVKRADDGCRFSPDSVKEGEVVVCAQRPQGYRIDPDVMQAKKAMRGGGPPKRPDRMKDDSCKVVGPMGCREGQGTINLLAAAATAAKMAERLSKGQEIGSMFVTDPTPSEYQLYLEAKKAREAKEEEAKALAAAKAVEAVKAQAAKTEASASAPAR